MVLQIIHTKRSNDVGKGFRLILKGGFVRVVAPARELVNIEGECGGLDCADG